MAQGMLDAAQKADDDYDGSKARAQRKLH